MIEVKRIKGCNDINYIVKDLFGIQAYTVDYLDYGEELVDENYEEILTVYSAEEECEEEQLATIFITHNGEIYIHFFFEGIENRWIHDTEIIG